jgi:hypothetical protein
MYKCCVEKRILSDRREYNDYTSLCYELEIEHAPMLGQELRKRRWFSGPVIRIIWDEDEECFYVRVEDEVPHLRGADEFSHDWLVRNYKHQGWVDCPRKIRRLEKGTSE